jgi:hypothetical protein
MTIATIIVWPRPTVKERPLVFDNACQYQWSAVVPDAAARPTVAPSEEDGKLDGDDGSGDVVAI